MEGKTLKKCRLEKDAEKIATLRELATRITQLRERYRLAVKINDEITSAGPKPPYFCQSRGALVREIDGEIIELVKIDRIHPEIPVTISPALRFDAFVPGQTSANGAQPRPTNDAEIDLGAKTEDYYYAASRFWDLVEKGLCLKSKSRFIGVKMVRNRLLEHSEKGAPNSFGATNFLGPIVKPIRHKKSGEENFDAGMIPNTHEMLSKAIEAISG